MITTIARRLLVAGAISTLALSLMPPAVASSPAPSTAAAGSGSLVFVRNNNVWIAQPDGTRARALTTDGTSSSPWLSPSQADTGEVVASHAQRIVRMSSTGQVLTTIDPPALMNSAGHTMDGTPAYVAISPDGRLIAYTQSAYGCYPGVSCDTRFATAYTAADHLTDPAAYPTSYDDAPEWITGTRTVQGGGAFREVNLQDLGSPAFHWYRDSEVESPARDLSDPAVSRDGNWVATVRGWGSSTTILWSLIPGDARTDASPGLPTPWCETNEEPVGDPAWSADSLTLAWGTDAGIYMTTGPVGCNQPTLAVPGGSQPSFSAAPFVDGHTSPPSNTVAPTVAGTGRVGRVLTARPGSWTPRPSSFTYAWLRNGKVIAGATGKTYVPVGADTGKKIAVRVTAIGAGGASAPATSAALTVKP